MNITLITVIEAILYGSIAFFSDKTLNRFYLSPDIIRLNQIFWGFVIALTILINYGLYLYFGSVFVVSILVMFIFIFKKINIENLIGKNKLPFFWILFGIFFIILGLLMVTKKVLVTAISSEPPRGNTGYRGKIGTSGDSYFIESTGDKLYVEIIKELENHFISIMDTNKIDYDKHVSQLNNYYFKDNIRRICHSPQMICKFITQNEDASMLTDSGNNVSGYSCVDPGDGMRRCLKMDSEKQGIVSNNNSFLDPKRQWTDNSNTCIYPKDTETETLYKELGCQIDSDCSKFSLVPNKSYDLIYTDRECVGTSDEVNLGIHKSIEDCYSACVKKAKEEGEPCKYFRFGKHHKKGSCYWEKTCSSTKYNVYDIFQVNSITPDISEYSDFETEKKSIIEEMKKWINEILRNSAQDDLKLIESLKGSPFNTLDEMGINDPDDHRRLNNKQGRLFLQSNFETEKYWEQLRQTGKDVCKKENPFDEIRRLNSDEEYPNKQYWDWGSCRAIIKGCQIHTPVSKCDS